MSADDNEPVGQTGEPVIVWVALSMEYDDWWVHGVFTDRDAAWSAAKEGAKRMVGKESAALLAEALLNDAEPGSCGMILEESADA